MKFGVFRNVSGNIEALSDADRQFDEIGVNTKICLGEIVGMYPYVDDCVKFLVDRGYVVLRNHVDDGFVGYCEGSFDFRGWTTSYLVEALKFVRPYVSDMAVKFLRELPQRQVINGVAFEGIADVRGGYLYRREDVAAAFASWSQDTVIHAAHLDPHVWREDLSEIFLSSGLNILDSHGRLLISTGGLGSYYHGSSATKRPAAVVFDDQERSVRLLRPMCNARKIFDRLRSKDYPHGALEYLETSEYKEWL